MVEKKGDTKIMQMSFMILFVFIFFALVGLFFISYYSKDLTTKYESQQIDLAIASLETIANMPELNCASDREYCLDEDKLLYFSLNSNNYSDFWPVAYVKVIKLYPKNSTTTYNIYSSPNPSESVIGRDMFVSICKQVRRLGLEYQECSIGKLDVGVKLRT